MNHDIFSENDMNLLVRRDCSPSNFCRPRQPESTEVENTAGPALWRVCKQLYNETRHVLPYPSSGVLFI